MSGEARIFVEGLAHRRKSAQRIAPTFAYADTPGSPATAFYNPFGVDLPLVARRMIGLPPRKFAQDLHLWRALVGIEGEKDDWNWRVSVGSSQSRTASLESGDIVNSRLFAALGPSGPDASGHIVCGSRDAGSGIVPSANVIAGCVPFNIFGGPDSITQDQLNYISVPLRNSGSNEQDIAEAQLSGRWKGWFAADTQWVIGAEYRRESGSFLGDPLRADGTGSRVSQDLPNSSFDARELFGELRIPLLRERSLAHDLTLDLGVRRSKFSSFDRHTAWQGDLRWQPTRELTVRANYSKVFRAPSLFELYQRQAIDAGFVRDPCGHNPTSEQQVHCAANGVPGGSYVQRELDPFQLVLGGNPDLGPERGRSRGAGIVFSRHGLTDFLASLDYFDVRLRHFIGAPTADHILFECAQRGTREVCGAIERRPDGTISSVSAVARNFGKLSTRGLDFLLSWRSATRFGEWDARLLTTYVSKWNEQPFPGGAVFNRAGQVRFTDLPHILPRFRALTSLDWKRGAWKASYSLEHIGQLKECSTESGWCRPVRSALFHDVEGSYDLSTGISVSTAIRNLTDEAPPFLDNGTAINTDSTYRLLGRTYFMQLRYEVR